MDRLLKTNGRSLNVTRLPVTAATRRPLTKGMTHSLWLRRATDRQPPTGVPPSCSAAGERSSTASAVPSSSSPSSFAIASASLAVAGHRRAERRRLDRPGFASRPPSPSGSTRRVRGRRRRDRRGLPGRGGRRRPVAELPGDHRRLARPPRRRRSRRRHDRLGGDPATTGSSAPTGRRPTSSSDSRSPTRRRSTRCPSSARSSTSRPALTLLLTGVAPGDPGPGRPVGEGAAPGGDGVVPVRGADPDPRLRLARRRRHAARRRRAGHPDDARRRLPRRPGDRAVDLRPERGDDARPGARHRLLAVHGQPLPRGAAHAAATSARPSRSRSPRAARPSRSPGWPSRSGCPACSCSSRPRCGRSASAAR